MAPPSLGTQVFERFFRDAQGGRCHGTHRGRAPRFYWQGRSRHSTFLRSEMKEMLIGAVAYDPKVVTIWEGIRSYLRDDAKLPCEIVLFLSYGAQVEALLNGRIDVGWNTNLAYLQAVQASNESCKAIAMRDTDVGWKTFVIAPKGGSVKSVQDLQGKETCARKPRQRPCRDFAGSFPQRARARRRAGLRKPTL